MTQISFSDAEYSIQQKITRRQKFLTEMDACVPWKRLCQVIERKANLASNRRYDTEQRLRIYCLQQWFGLSDPEAEDALYDSMAMRKFVYGSVMTEHVPDESTILRFRHLLEAHQLTLILFKEINQHLQERGITLKSGTLVDATIIHAPSSTKNTEQSRDPEMASTKKGNNYHFGLKAHVGVDDESGVVHRVSVTSANVADVSEAHKLIRDTDTHVGGDAGYQGLAARKEMRGFKGQVITAMKRKKLRQLKQWGGEAGLALGEAMTQFSQVRAKVEHPFRVIKCQFGYRKTRYRGLAKNRAHIYMLFGLANLLSLRKQLLS